MSTLDRLLSQLLERLPALPLSLLVVAVVAFVVVSVALIALLAADIAFTMLTTRPRDAVDPAILERMRERVGQAKHDARRAP